MEVAEYGHFGFALLLLPTAAADYLEYERFQMLDVLQPAIDAGKVKVFSINSINSEAWLNNQMEQIRKDCMLIKHDEMRTQSAMLMLRMSINARVDYLMRVVPPKDLHHMLGEFDTFIQQTFFQSILNRPINSADF
jgi:esterase/lipase superfamily enzyme